MEQFFIDYLERLTDLHDDIQQAIVDLPVEALDWSPGDGMNSMAVLVTHTMGSERFWLGDVAVGKSSGRVRAREFTVNNLTVSDLQQLLDETLTFAKETVAALSFELLDELRDSPYHEQPFTVGWCLLHALEHTAVHLGHIQLMRQLWEMR